MSKREPLRTLGEQLRYLREEAGLSVAELAEKTRIQKKYLEWLEDERFDLLPPPVYVRGFITHWAKACYADVEHTLLQFDRVQALLLRDQLKEKRWKLSDNSFIFTGRMLVAVLVGVVILGGALTAGARYLHIGGAPVIDIVQPASIETIVRDQWILVRGTTENVTHLTVAGQEIAVGEEGSFSQQVVLQPGVNVVRVEGVGKNGDTVEIMRKVVQIGESPPQETEIDLEEFQE